MPASRKRTSYLLLKSRGMSSKDIEKFRNGGPKIVKHVKPRVDPNEPPVNQEPVIWCENCNKNERHIYGWVHDGKYIFKCGKCQSVRAYGNNGGK